MTMMSVRIAMRAVALVGLALAGAACGDKHRDSDEHQPSTPVTAAMDHEAAALTVDPRTQYDLAAAIKQAEKLPGDEAADRLHDIRQDYQGKRFHWRVYYAPALCPSPERCHVNPFDRAGADKNIVHGWMPRLDLSESALAGLRQACAGISHCAFEFEGTLTRLVLSSDDLTLLGFTSVSLLPRAGQAMDAGRSHDDPAVSHDDPAVSH